jgi:hypothetical protein
MQLQDVTYCGGSRLPGRRVQELTEAKNTNQGRVKKTVDTGFSLIYTRLRLV